MVRKRFDEGAHDGREQDLDQLREEAAARTGSAQRYEPPADDVTTAERKQRPGLFGKVSAAVAGVLLVVAVVVAAVLIRTLGAGFPLQLERTAESVDQPEPGEDCLWHLEATLRNESDRTVTITGLSTVLDRRMSQARDMRLPTMAPGEIAVASGTWALNEADVCPEPDEINHTNLVIRYSQRPTVSGQPAVNSTVSRGF